MIFSFLKNFRKKERKPGDEFRSNLDPSVFVADSVHVLGWKQVRIGNNSVIGDDTWININFRDRTEPALIIGQNCFIGRRNFFSTGQLIQIGPFALTGLDCHFLGADHSFATPFEPYITTKIEGDGAIIVGANCWFGARVTVLKNITIGHGCVIGAGSVVTKSIPPFSIAVGSPARVIKRFDVSSNSWRPADELPAGLSIPSEKEYLEQIQHLGAKAGEYCRVCQVAASQLLGDL